MKGKSMTDPRSRPRPTDAWPQGVAQPSAPRPSTAVPFQPDWHTGQPLPPQPSPSQGQYGAPPAAPAARPGFAPASPRHKMTTWRVICGICWAAWTILFLGGAIAGLAQGNVGTFLAGAVLGGLTAWYDYRIWACTARRLTLFIIF